MSAFLVASFVFCADKTKTGLPILATHKKTPDNDHQEHLPSDPMDIMTNEQDSLLRGVVHDVNNNLMAILAGCDQLEYTIENPEDSRPLLETIRNHISMASQLVNDLTQNNNSEDTQVVMTQYELENLLKGIIPSLTLVTSNQVTIEIGSIITAPVFINPVLLHRILMQFVRNSMETGGNNVIMFISVRQRDGWCELSISDNGPGIFGIPIEDVFKPGTSTKTDHNRRGYGLSAVAYAVETWGGSCGAENLNGTGCRFWITFPLLDFGQTQPNK